jgi:hypothetical protein
MVHFGSIFVLAFRYRLCLSREIEEVKKRRNTREHLCTTSYMYGLYVVFGETAIGLAGTNTTIDCRVSRSLAHPAQELDALPGGHWESCILSKDVGIGGFWYG